MSRWFDSIRELYIAKLKPGQSGARLIYKANAAVS
jgi:hypothetical protein